jgi:CubicO group peptidase (beta-lactamase class C family)
VRHRLIAIAGAVLLPMPATPAAARSKVPVAATESFRLDPARIRASLQQMVARGRVTGASILIWKDGREAHFSSAGWADRENRKRIRRDSMFQIWSMTKPVTGVGLMRLWEQGRFGLDDPLHWYLPEYVETKVFAGTDATGRPILKAPDRPILVRDILRHTAGFGYDPGPSFPGQRWKEADPLTLNHDLAQFSAKLATVPLLFEPGTRWSYSAAVDVKALRGLHAGAGASAAGDA